MRAAVNYRKSYAKSVLQIEPSVDLYVGTPPREQSWSNLFKLIHLFCNVIREAHTFLQRVFCTESDIVLFLPISKSLLFLKVIQQIITSSSMSSRHFCPSLYLSFNTCLRRQSLHITWKIRLTFFLLLFIEYSSFSSLCYTSFPTRSVQLIFSILLQHQFSKLSRCFWSSVRSVKNSAPQFDIILKTYV